MKRVLSLTVTAMLGGALLTLGAARSYAQADTNIFSLAVSSTNTSNINALKAGDVLKLDVFLKSDNKTQINGYQASIEFNSQIFDPKTSSTAGIYTKNSNNGFDVGPSVIRYNDTNATNNASGFRRIFTGGESFSLNGTTTFPDTPTLLGTFNLNVLSTAPTGTAEIRFTDLVPNPPTLASQRGNIIAFSPTDQFTPSFGNGVVAVRVAAVPETGTIIGMGSMLGMGLLGIRRRKSRQAA